MTSQTHFVKSERKNSVERMFQNVENGSDVNSDSDWDALKSAHQVT